MQNNKLHWIEIILLIGILIVLGVQIKSDNGIFGGRSSSDSNDGDELILWDGVGTMASIASYDGGDDTIITDTAHGLVVGDVVNFYTASVAFGGGDAPGFTMNADYYVITASISTVFEISTVKSGTALDLTVASAGGGEFFTKEIAESNAIDVESRDKFSFTVASEEATSVSMCFVGSNMVTAPNWYASQSADNRYEYLGIYDAATQTETEGDTCLEIAGTDEMRMFDVYDENLKWFFVKTGTYASGSLDIRLK